jgi:hypothetical protein
MSKGEAQLATWPESLEDWPEPEAWKVPVMDWPDLVTDWPPLVCLDWPEPEPWPPLIEWELPDLAEGWEQLAFEWQPITPWSAEDTKPPVVNKC